MQTLYKKLIILVLVILPLIAIIAPTASAASNPVDSNAQRTDSITKAWSVFKAAGANEKTADAILGNWNVESGIDPTTVETRSNVLSSKEIRQLNSNLNTFSHSTINGEPANTQFAVKIIDSTDNESIEDYSQDLFNKMAIGDKKHNMGILLVVALDDHQFRIQLGDGWDNTNLNEEYIESYVFTDDVEEQFREGNYYEGITSIVKSTMQLAGTTVKIPASLNINSKEMSNQIRTDQAFAVLLIKGMFLAGIIALMVGLLSQIRKHFWFKYYNRMKIRVKNLIKNNEPEFNNYPKADIQLIKSDPVKQSLNILKYYNIDTLSKEYVDEYVLYYKDKPSIWQIISKKADKKPLTGLDSFLEKKAQAERLAIEKAENIREIKKLMERNSYNWALDSDDFPEYFLTTKLKITIENLKLVSNNLHNTKKILSKQKNAEDYDIDKQAMDLTRSNPTTVYDTSLLSNLATYSLLSHSYRSDAWFDAQSSSSSDSSSFSDFGGGGFSSGGGASGGW